MSTTHTNTSTHTNSSRNTPYTCQILIRYGFCLCFLLLIVLGFLSRWIPAALNVDCNGFAYSIEMKGSYAPGGDAGDDLYFERIEMQNSGGFIGMAASLNFFERFAITFCAACIAYHLAYMLLKTINEYRREYNKNHKKH